MASETTKRLAPELGRGFCLLIETIEDRAQLWIQCGDLDDAAALHPADVSVVLEVEGPWSLWQYPTDLVAGLGKDEHLRGHVYFQLAKQGGQISIVAVMLELRVPAFDPLPQSADVVLWCAGRVWDGGVFRVVTELQPGQQTGWDEDGRAGHRSESPGSTIPARICAKHDAHQKFQDT